MQTSNSVFFHVDLPRLLQNVVSGFCEHPERIRRKCVTFFDLASEVIQYLF